MKTPILLSAALLTGSLLASQASPADDVKSAAQKLNDESSYTWHITTVVPESARFKPGPTDGKTEKGGVTYEKISFGDNTTEIYMKGTNAVLTDPDGGWQTLADMDESQPPGRFMVPMIRNFKTPAAQAVDLVAGCKDLQETNGAFSSDLTEEGVKKMMSFRRRGGNTPNISNSSGTATFWINNGELTKYETHLKGTMTYNGNDVNLERTTTVEFKDVGSTTINVPDDVKKKL
jgi:hypothetical protein